MTQPNQQQDPNRFLMGGGGKSAKFEQPNDEVVGTLIDAGEMRQQTDIKDGKPLFWDDGSPKMQLVLQLQTELREDPEDDGVRNLYVKGGFKNPTLQKAVADAVRAAGAKGLQAGGTLRVRFTGTGQASQGMSPPKFYVAKYDPPAQTFLQQPQAPAQQAAPAADPWATPPPAQQAVASQPPQQAAPPHQAAGGATAVAPQMVKVRDASGVVQEVTPEIAALITQVGGQLVDA